jgi:hypothetical protein
VAGDGDAAVGVAMISDAEGCGSGGLAFLSGPNLGWGSSTDVLAMFLWAVGVHQVAGVTGSTAVRKVVEGGMKEAAA